MKSQFFLSFYIPFRSYWQTVCLSLFYICNLDTYCLNKKILPRFDIRDILFGRFI